MKPHNHKFATLALASALAFGGCAATQDGQMAQAQGTGIGALLGGIAGYAIGGDATGALVGAAIGGTGGFLYGTHIANKKAQYANAEAWLDACIAEARTTNQNAIAKQQQLRNQLAALETRAKNAKVANNARELRAVKSELAKVQTQMQNESQNLEKQSSNFNQALADPDAKNSSRVGGLRSAVSQIDQTRASYQGDLKRVAALNSTLDV